MKTQSMKTKTVKIALGGLGMALAVTLLVTSSCTKTKTVTDTVTNTVTKIDSVIVNADLEHSVNNGTDAFNALYYPFPPATVASMGITADSGQFYLDQEHCNAMWETQYEGYASMLTGRFNTFNIQCNFDEANPKNIKITAWVDLSSFNTGEPGRDSWGVRKNVTTGAFVNGCGPGYVGLQFDSTTAAYPADVEYVVPSTDTARFVSTPGAATKSGNIYLVPGVFTFRGDVNLPVVMKMGYYPVFTQSSVTSGKTYKTDHAGLYGQFSISQKQADGAAAPTNTADSVLIRVDANFVTSKYTKSSNTYNTRMSHK
jgi:hypothetical protein